MFGNTPTTSTTGTAARTTWKASGTWSTGISLTKIWPDRREAPRKQPDCFRPNARQVSLAGVSVSKCDETATNRYTPTHDSLKKSSILHEVARNLNHTVVHGGLKQSACSQEQSGQMSH